MNKKIVFLTMFVLALGILNTSAFAVKVTEARNECIFDNSIMMDYCETELEFEFDTGDELAIYNNIVSNFSNYMTQKDGDMRAEFNYEGFEVEANKIKVKGTVPMGTQNYWGIYPLYNSTWWNSSYPYCYNINVTYPQALYPAYFNMTYNANMSHANFSGIPIINTSCNNSGSRMDVFLRDKNDSQWATWDILLDSNTTTNLSFYYGYADDVTNYSDLNAVWDNPISYTTSDENTGTTLNDKSGIDGVDDGTIDISSSPWVTGRKGYALDYERGNTDYTDFGDQNDVSTGMTLECWVNPEDYSGTNEYMAISKGESAGVGSYQLGLYGNGSAFCNIRAGAWGTAIKTSQTVPKESWSLISCTYDGSNVRVYVDGIEGNSIADTGNIDDSSSNLYQGAFLTTTHNFDGILDECKIYDTDLSASVVLSHFAENEPVLTQGDFFSNETPAEPEEPSVYLTNETWRRCLDNDTEQYHVAQYNNGTFLYANDTYTYCQNECNDYNLDSIMGTLCNPDDITQYLILFWIVVLLVLLYKWLRSRR